MRGRAKLDYSRVIQVIGGDLRGAGGGGKGLPTLPSRVAVASRAERRFLAAEKRSTDQASRHTPESNNKSIAREVSGVDTRSSRGDGREGFGGGCIIE